MPWASMLAVHGDWHTRLGTRVLPSRDKVAARMKASLQREASSFNIMLDDVAIIDLTFGRDFTAAVEAKQVAQQDAERAPVAVEVEEPAKPVLSAEKSSRFSAFLRRGARSSAPEQTPGLAPKAGRPPGRAERAPLAG